MMQSDYSVSSTNKDLTTQVDIQTNTTGDTPYSHAHWFPLRRVNKKVQAAPNDAKKMSLKVSSGSRQSLEQEHHCSTAKEFKVMEGLQFGRESPVVPELTPLAMLPWSVAPSDAAAAAAELACTFPRITSRSIPRLN